MLNRNQLENQRVESLYSYEVHICTMSILLSIFRLKFFHWTEIANWHELTNWQMDKIVCLIPRKCTRGLISFTLLYIHWVCSFSELDYALRSGDNRTVANDSHHWFHVHVWTCHILCVLKLRKAVKSFIKQNDTSKTANGKRLHPSGDEELQDT